jgi:hypothetical protein
MSHRRPTRRDVQIHDGLLIDIAALTCGDVLMTDLRIRDAYTRWTEAHDLPRLCRRFLAWRTKEYAEPFQRAVWGGALPGEIETLAALLASMHVPWVWVSPMLLHVQFPKRYATDYSPAHPPHFVGDIEMVATAKPARRPRTADLESLVRHVHYWYRHDVKEPPDKIWELEAVEQARTGDHITSRRHSTVIQGIQRVTYLLGLNDRYEITLETCPTAGGGT